MKPSGLGSHVVCLALYPVTRRDEHYRQLTILSGPSGLLSSDLGSAHVCTPTLVIVHAHTYVYNLMWPCTYTTGSWQRRGWAAHPTQPFLPHIKPDAPACLDFQPCGPCCGLSPKGSGTASPFPESRLQCERSQPTPKPLPRSTERGTRRQLSVSFCNVL